MSARPRIGCPRRAQFNSAVASGRPDFRVGEIGEPQKRRVRRIRPDRPRFSAVLIVNHTGKPRARGIWPAETVPSADGFRGIGDINKIVRFAAALYPARNRESSETLRLSA